MPKGKIEETEEELKKRRTKTPTLLKGFKDILPEDEMYYNTVFNSARKLSEDYSYGRIRLPLLEKTQLFERTIGKGTDIVEKELFSFLDKGEVKVAMRPEATAQMVRAYIEHGMINMTQPVKMWEIGSMFRYDKPQKGRYRQFRQWDLEVIGSEDPIIDAQVIIMANQFFKEMGLNVLFKINSLGTPATRSEYIMELVTYFKQYRRHMSDVDKKRLSKNPLRLLDSKEPEIQEYKAGAPQIVDWLDEASKQHFMKVLEYLDEMEVAYELDPFLVRGLDYYDRTVFEIVLADDSGERAQNSLGGGGRYDSLLPQLGARADVKGAMGMAIGLERVVLAMKDANVEVPKQGTTDVFFCQLGEAARRKGLRIFEEFRQRNVAIAEAFGKGSLKAQLEIANKRDAKLTLILGQKEVLDGTIIVRDMDTGSQEIVPLDKVAEIVAKQLA
jgi:histidyl-tRNA synthetase